MARQSQLESIIMHLVEYYCNNLGSYYIHISWEGFKYLSYFKLQIFDVSNYSIIQVLIKRRMRDFSIL
jgi:hypothetical protein